MERAVGLCQCIYIHLVVVQKYHIPPYILHMLGYNKIRAVAGQLSSPESGLATKPLTKNFFTFFSKSVTFDLDLEVTQAGWDGTLSNIRATTNYFHPEVQTIKQFKNFNQKLKQTPTPNFHTGKLKIILNDISGYLNSFERARTCTT